MGTEPSGLTQVRCSGWSVRCRLGHRAWVVVLGFLGLGCGRVAAPGAAPPDGAGTKPVEEFTDEDDTAPKRPHRSREDRNGTGVAIFSSDGKYALTGRSDGVAYQWALPVGIDAGSFCVSPQHKQVTALASSLDGRLALAGCLHGDGAVIVWDIATKKKVCRFAGHPAHSGITAIAVSPDGKRVLSAGTIAPGLLLWELPTGKKIRAFPVSTGLEGSVAFSPDGKRALSGGHKDGLVRLWDLASGRQLRTFKGAEGLGFSGSARFVVTGRFQPGRWGTAEPTRSFLEVWEVASGQQVLSLPYTHTSPSSPGTPMALLPGGRRVLTVSPDDGIPQVWDLHTGKLVRTYSLTPLRDRVGGIQVSRDGKRALIYNSDGVVCWDLVADEEVCTVAAMGPYPPMVWDASFSRDGKLALIRRDSRLPVLWDVTTGRPIRKLKGTTGTVVLSPDGKWALSSGGWNTSDPLTLWDTATGKAVRKWKESMDGMSFSPDGKFILTPVEVRSRSGEVTWGGVTIWDVATGKQVRQIDMHKSTPFYAKFLPDGRYVLTGDSKRGVTLWDVRNGEAKWTVREPKLTNLVMTSDGKRAAFYHCAHPKWVEVATGKTLRPLRLEEGKWGSGLSFSPDGKLMLWDSGAWDGFSTMTKLTDVATGKVIRVLPKKGLFTGSWVRGFTPQGKLVFVEDQPYRLRLYDPVTGREVRADGGERRSGDK